MCDIHIDEVKITASSHVRGQLLSGQHQFTLQRRKLWNIRLAESLTMDNVADKS